MYVVALSFDQQDADHFIKIWKRLSAVGINDQVRFGYSPYLSLTGYEDIPAVNLADKVENLILSKNWRPITLHFDGATELVCADSRPLLARPHPVRELFKRQAQMFAAWPSARVNDHPDRWLGAVTLTRDTLQGKADGVREALSEFKPFEAVADCVEIIEVTGPLGPANIHERFSLNY